MNPLKVRGRQVIGVFLLMTLGTVVACGGPAKTKKVSVPVDTAIVDDDTLEGANAPAPKRTEHAR